ncbi:hypothetical protein FRC09_015756 [Ceratobasidium sp. 395]|nr:hypothetical protein FRC09_015756 [Ceratobasidium sp. 395]
MAAENHPTKTHFNANGFVPPRFANLFPPPSQSCRQPLTEGSSATGSDSFSHIADSVVPSDTEVVSSVPSSPRAESPQLSYETDSESPGGMEEPFFHYDIGEFNDDPAGNLPLQGLKRLFLLCVKTSLWVGSHASAPSPTSPVADRQVVQSTSLGGVRIRGTIIRMAILLLSALAAGDCPCQSFHHQETGLSVSIHQLTRMDTTISTVEIEALLDLLYTPFYATKGIKPETYRLALPLCIKWGLEELRVAILSELEKGLDLFDRYALARELNIPEWEKYCLSALVIRPMGLTLDEGRRLGVDAVVFISTLREDARTRNQCLHTCVSCDLKKRSTGRSVDIAFVHERVQEWMERAR